MVKIRQSAASQKHFRRWFKAKYGNHYAIKSIHTNRAAGKYSVGTYTATVTEKRVPIIKYKLMRKAARDKALRKYRSMRKNAKLDLKRRVARVKVLRKRKMAKRRKR